MNAEALSKGLVNQQEQREALQQQQQSTKSHTDLMGRAMITQLQPPNSLRFTSMNPPEIRSELPRDELGEETARALLDQLLEDSRLYKSGKDYRDLLDFVARMRNFAPFNALLLQIQKPGMRFAASRRDWREKFGADVTEDARPLLILWPFGPVALVYDCVDVTGGSIPVYAQAFVAKGVISKSRIQALIGKMAAKDITTLEIDVGDGSAGSIRVLEAPTDGKKRGLYAVKFNGNHAPAVQFVTLAHELAHLFLGHLGEDKAWGIKNRRHCDLSQREIEAESVAFLIAARNSVESKSETYLSNYVGMDATEPQLDLYQIMRASGQIEALLGITAHTQFDNPSKPIPPTQQHFTL